MEAKGNGRGPPPVREDAVGHAAPAAGPAMVPVVLVGVAPPARANMANMAAPALPPPVMAPPAGQVIANLRAPALAQQVMAPHAGQVFAILVAPAPMIPPGGVFDIAGALQGSDPPSKSDMRYKIWQKL